MSWRKIDQVPEWKALDDLPIIKKTYEVFYDPRWGHTQILMAIRFYRKYTKEVAHQDYADWQREYPEIQYDEEEKYYYFTDDTKFRRFSRAQATLENRRRKAFVKRTKFEEWLINFSEVGLDYWNQILAGKIILQMRRVALASRISLELDDPNERVIPLKTQAEVFKLTTLRHIKQLREAVEKEAYLLHDDYIKNLNALSRLPYWIVLS